MRWTKLTLTRQRDFPCQKRASSTLHASQKKTCQFLEAEIKIFDLFTDRVLTGQKYQTFTVYHLRVGSRHDAISVTKFPAFLVKKAILLGRKRTQHFTSRFFNVARWKLEALGLNNCASVFKVGEAEWGRKEKKDTLTTEEEKNIDSLAGFELSQQTEDQICIEIIATRSLTKEVVRLQCWSTSRVFYTVVFSFPTASTLNTPPQDPSRQAAAVQSAL